MKVGFIAIPFGIVYGFIVLRLGHESKTALGVTLLAALVTVFKTQGMPPNK